jgi:radical SAM superfamily enzyme YgiQ (UPF0313 family)
VATERAAVAALHEHGIAVHGMFVAGLDTDDVTSAGATADFARKVGVDTFQLMAETPLPGTRLWRRMGEENRLLTQDWSLFDGHQVVMRPARMTPLDLQLSILDAMRRFYSWPRVLGSGLAGVLGHLPGMMETASPSVAVHLPALVKLAFARRWDEVAPLLREKFPRRFREGLAQALWLPAVRFYARRQLTAWCSTERARRHLEFLRSLDVKPL